MSSRCFSARQPASGISPSAPSAATSAGTDAEGAAGSNFAVALSTRPRSFVAPEKRFNVTSSPSRIPRSGFPPGCSFGSAEASSLKYSTIGVRVRATPNPWLLCMLRLSAAISPYDSPSSGL